MGKFLQRQMIQPVGRIYTLVVSGRNFGGCVDIIVFITKSEFKKIW